MRNNNVSCDDRYRQTGIEFFYNVVGQSLVALLPFDSIALPLGARLQIA
jgi:hypothetical protein